MYFGVSPLVGRCLADSNLKPNRALDVPPTVGLHRQPNHRVCEHLFQEKFCQIFSRQLVLCQGVIEVRQ